MTLWHVFRSSGETAVLWSRGVSLVAVPRRSLKWVVLVSHITSIEDQILKVLTSNFPSSQHILHWPRILGITICSCLLGWQEVCWLWYEYSLSFTHVITLSPCNLYITSQVITVTLVPYKIGNVGGVDKPETAGSAVHRSENHGVDIFITS